jgi:hypothetical protein
MARKEITINGQTVRPETAFMTVPCPKCNASAGHVCRGWKYRPRTSAHIERVHAFQKHMRCEGFRENLAHNAKKEPILIE